MLGLEDPAVIAAYLLCIISTLFCLVWGIIKWNVEDVDPEPETEIRQWIEEEDRVEEEL